MSEDFSHEDIPTILETARTQNSKNNVTGLLSFSRNCFLQCLEGTRSAVNETYHRIAQAPRHHKIVLLNYQEITERQFAEWAMGYIPESSLTAPVNLKFSGSASFSPYELSGESAHQLLASLQNAVPPHN